MLEVEFSILFYSKLYIARRRFSYTSDRTVDLTPQAKKGGLTRRKQNIKIQSANK